MIHMFYGIRFRSCSSSPIRIRLFQIEMVCDLLTKHITYRRSANILKSIKQRVELLENLCRIGGRVVRVAPDRVRVGGHDGDDLVRDPGAGEVCRGLEVVTIELGPDGQERLKPRYGVGDGCRL